VRYRRIALGAAWALFAHAAMASAITLTEAMKLAAAMHPGARMAQLEVEARQGIAREQGAYAYNPELTVEPQRRSLATGGTTNDYYVSLSQGIELGSKRSARKTAAELGVAIADARAEAARQSRMFNAAAAYIDLYYAEQSLILHRQLADMYRRLVRDMERRRKAGENSRLDLNLVQSAFASTLNALVGAEQTYRMRRAAFFTSIGQADDGKLEPPPAPKDWPALTGNADSAWKSRPDMRVLRLQAKQAEWLARQASSNRIPDITVSGMLGREAGDKLVKLGLSIPFPVWNSHQGAYRAAIAQRERLRSSLAWSRKKLRFEVEAALRNQQETARAAQMVLDSSVLRDSRNAIQLARRAWEAGELEPEEMVFRVRQAVDALNSSLETLRLAWLARIRLARALGRPELLGPVHAYFGVGAAARNVGQSRREAKRMVAPWASLATPSGRVSGAARRDSGHDSASRRYHSLACRLFANSGHATLARALRDRNHGRIANIKNKCEQALQGDQP